MEERERKREKIRNEIFLPNICIFCIGIIGINNVRTKVPVKFMITEKKVRNDQCVCIYDILVKFFVLAQIN